MDYQGNQKGKPEKTKKVVEKVVKGEVVSRPKPLGSKFRGIFFGGDFGDAARFIAAEVLLPALRNLVVDAATRGTERMVYGDRYAARRPLDYRPRVTYNNPLSRPVPREPRERAYLPDQPGLMPSRRRSSNEILIADREEAELVLERLIDIINQYDVASLADLYDLVGLPTTHVDNKWGWTFLTNVTIRQTREGYLIDLPQAEPI
jgi:hypothetical protein